MKAARQNHFVGATVFAFVAIVIAATPSSAQSQQAFRLPTKHGIFQVQIKERHGEGHRLLIQKDGKTLLDHSAFDFALIDPTTEIPNLGYTGKNLPLFDLNGDGTKDLIVRTWTGGAHCCYIYDIYSLDGRFKRIWHFDAGDGHMLTMKSHKHALPDLLIEDSTFRYFGAGVFTMPVVALRWQDGKFRLDLARMRRGLDKHPEPKIAEIKKSLASEQEGELYDCMLNLYYTGRAAKANKFAELPKHFHQEFLKQLSKSPFYSEIKNLNHGKL